MNKALHILITLLVISTGTQAQTKSARELGREKAANGHEYVDLGLSVMWATMNVGASTPHDIGKYYAWGETKGKNEYTIYNYKFFKETENEKVGNIYVFGKYKRGYTKYVSDAQMEKEGYDGFCDNKRLLDYEDDAARTNWGGGWRIPYVSELNELCTKCTWQWIKTSNGKYVYVVTGPNGKHIILPATGARFGMKNEHVGIGGYYWSANIYKGAKANGAYILHFTKEGHGITENETRYDGRCIRPVIKFKRN